MLGKRELTLKEIKTSSSYIALALSLNTTGFLAEQLGCLGAFNNHLGSLYVDKFMTSTMDRAAFRGLCI